MMDVDILQKFPSVEKTPQFLKDFQFLKPKLTKIDLFLRGATESRLFGLKRRPSGARVVGSLERQRVVDSAGHDPRTSSVVPFECRWAPGLPEPTSLFNTHLPNLFSPNCAYRACFARSCTARPSFLKRKTIMLHLLKGPVQGHITSQVQQKNHVLLDVIGFVELVPLGVIFNLAIGQLVDIRHQIIFASQPRSLVLFYAFLSQTFLNQLCPVRHRVRILLMTFLGLRLHSSSAVVHGRDRSGSTKWIH